MTVDKRKLKKLTESMRMRTTKEQERIILQRFGEEPYPYEWTEQDISIQLRNFFECGEFVKASRDNRENDLMPLDGENF